MARYFGSLGKETRKLSGELEVSLSATLDSTGVQRGVNTFGIDSKSQNETLYKESLYSSFTPTTLNVSADAGEEPKLDPGQTQRPTFNEGEGSINLVGQKAVEEIVALTGDEASKKRFWQLWEVAERNQALSAWNAALRALQVRQRASSQQTLERPGAYFCKICVKEMEKREIFVPTNAEKLAERDVAETIRLGLFGDNLRDGDAKAPSSPPVKEKPPVAPSSPKKADLPATPEQRDAQLSALEREGGAVYQEFLQFISDQREIYVSELGPISSTAKERLLSAFDRPEKRHDHYQKWRNSTDIALARIVDGLGYPDWHEASLPRPAATHC